MTSSSPVARVARLLGAFLGLFFLSSLAVGLLHGHTGGRLGLGTKSVVAVVPVEGGIVRSDDFVETLRDLRDDAGVSAVVLRVNSPGGGVAPSQEMYSAVRDLAGTKPVVASLGSVAASGGYYVASAADEIVASPGSLTGSIGVIMSLTNVSGLLDKLGVEADVLKAGSRKDMGSPFRALTPEDRKLFQEMLDQVHGQFIEAVAAGRKMDVAAMRKLADGRVFTGQQAKELGLVDRLGSLQDAVRTAAARAGVEGEPEVETRRPSRRPWWLRAAVGDEAEAPVEPLAALLGRVAGAARGARGEGRELLWRAPLATDGLRW
ncbi:MAG: signal peptide peptidase SppA [Alphaproteobacteria bacterium]